MALGKQIKGFLIANDINQQDIANKINISNSTMSDKLNEKVKMSTDEFFNILIAINEISNINVDANYFQQKVNEEFNNKRINREEE